MDADLPSSSLEIPESTAIQHTNNDFTAENMALPAACILCRRMFAPENEATRDLEVISICGDCKFLFLEDVGSPLEDSHRRRPSRGRQSRYSSSDSVENLFSQQFTHMINSMRQNQAAAPANVYQHDDGNSAAILQQPTSSRTTPSGSRRWRQVVSDTESDGFDNMDSLYGENESNISFGGYRNLHGESDAVSFSAYGGESDISVDGHGFLDTDMFGQPDDGTDLDSDTDIDPMHAGLNQWNSDDQEEEEETEWEETDAEESTVETMEGRSQTQYFPTSRPNNRPFHIPTFEGTFGWRFREGRQAYITNALANLEESDLPPHIRNSGDYLDATGFEALLEHLAETESSRRGAPPAAVSFVKSLPHIIINEDHENVGDLTCAVCKEHLSVGTEVNQLPCFHLYHPACILPWLSARNSCPLCRYELPTDDKEYEEGKRSNNPGMVIHENQHQNLVEDDSSYVSDDTEVAETSESLHSGIQQGEPPNACPAINSSGRASRRQSWFFLATAPIVGIVGMALVFWLGSPLIGRRVPLGPGNNSLFEQGQHQSGSSVNSPVDIRENRRRWWSFF